VFGFLSARAALREHGFASKRGILLFGPPGTGKTHFIRYLLSQLPDHTSLIVTAEQVAAFDEVMAIAPALQPSIVVIVDADLIAGDRDRLRSDCSEILLNSLLKHMDGLTDDAEIVFILTTNRPEALEAAIRDRPGRIDQTIEIPKPDAECRARLLDLYRGKMEIASPVSEQCVKRTANASAAFMKELARRMAQFAILRGDQRIVEIDTRLAFEEMLGSGAFTAIALGADEVE
jgi:ATP-dependent 26S proteasome regulatory subunit